MDLPSIYGKSGTGTIVVIVVIMAKAVAAAQAACLFCDPNPRDQAGSMTGSSFETVVLVVQPISPLLQDRWQQAVLESSHSRKDCRRYEFLFLRPCRLPLAAILVPFRECDLVYLDSA